MQQFVSLSLSLMCSVVLVLENAELLEAATSVLRATSEKLATLDSQKVNILNSRCNSVGLLVSVIYTILFDFK